MNTGIERTMKSPRSAMDRRAFIAGAFIAGAGAIASSLVGCDKPNAAAEQDSGTWDEEFDVIVVGGGIAGASAAITVAEEGEGVSCLLLEKESEPAGNSPFCGGSSLWTNDPETVKTHISKLSDGHVPEELIDAFTQGLGESLDWVRGLGASENNLIVVEPDPTTIWEFPEVEGSEALGTFMFDSEGEPNQTHIHTFLLSKVAERSDVIDYRTRTALESLVVDHQTSEVVGVVADGKRFKANKGVIMCTGGFENDAEMLFDYSGVKGAFPLGGPGNTGDGHRAVMAIGADMWHMHAGTQFWLECRSLDNRSRAYTLHDPYTKQLGITVGVNGRRFYMDYDGIVTSPETLGDDLTRNVGCRHGFFQFGGEWKHIPLPSTAWFIFDAEGLEKGAAFPADPSVDIVADGWAHKADSIEKLADMIEVPADELTDTVKQWNIFCESGRDLAFYRPEETLQPVKSGPFYAMRCAPAFTSTYGGPVRSAKAEVLNPFGEVIGGLYAAGEFGSVWGYLYQGAGMLADGEVFGRIAARSAIARA